LALRHEHAPIDLKTGRLTQLNPRTGLVGAITVNRFAARADNISQGGHGRRPKGRQYHNKPLHARYPSTVAPLTKAPQTLR
jgi:hypothetical protein